MFFKKLFLHSLCSIAFCFLQCNDIKKPPLWSFLLVQRNPGNIGMVTSDFGGSGRYNVLDPRGNFVLPGFTPIHSDASLRFWDGKIFIINKLNKDSIQILNPNLGNITEKEFSVNTGTNPHDIQLINPNKAYVSRYNSRSLLIINPNDGSFLGEIDLSQYAETSSAGGIPDGLPEMSWMVRYGGRLFITLQRLDRNNPGGFFPPSDKSLLIELDTVSNKPLREFTFQSTNPISKPQVVTIFGSPHIIFSTPGRLGFISELDGGIEAFNLDLNQFRSGFLLQETNAGGDILDVQVKDENLGFASVLDKQFNKKIISFNPQSGLVFQSLIEVPSSVSSNFSGLLLTRDGLLILGIRDFSGPGVLVFDTNGGIRSLTPIPIRTELTPIDFEELGDF
jgi:hypothetical protein